MRESMDIRVVMSRLGAQKFNMQRITSYIEPMSTETEILADVEALKNRFGDTKALYREVCGLLFFRYGLTPTANKLYQYVRKGTMSTPAEALAKFWDDLRAKARVEIDHPDLPEEVKAAAAEGIAQIWRQATSAARGELAAIRVELQADQERARHLVAQAELAAGQAQATVEQLRRELTSANETMERLRMDREAEGRAHAGTAARVQELQTQLEQARVQLERMQEGFSADLARAREAVHVADQRAASAERRALLEVEQERQARAKAEKQVEAFRSQVSQADMRERQAALGHAEALARLQSKYDSVSTAENTSQQVQRALEQELRAAREQLQVSQQEATRYRIEAQTVQSLVDRLAAPAPSARQRRAKKVA